MRGFFLIALLVFSTILHAEENSATDASVVADQSRLDTLVDSIRQQVMAGNYSRGRLLMLAAQQHNANACNLLGWMFDNGKGVSLNSIKAREWFESCASDSPLASYNAGVIYAAGRGVNPDMKIAIHYFQQAWKLGGDSFHNSVKQIPIRIAFYYYETKKDYKMAWRWAIAASEVDVRYGKYLVGRMIAEEKAPANINPTTSIRYLTESMEAYNPSSASLLSWLYGTGKFTDKDYALAERYAIQAKGMGSNENQDWSTSLSIDEKSKAEISANNWLSDHKKPTPMNFSSTLNGSEEQFRIN